MRRRATQNYLPSPCLHASVSCQHCFSFVYDTHLLHSSLEDDPFKKRQNRKATFPPSGPAKQTRNPQIKHSLSASNRCCNVLPPSPSLRCSPGNGQHWLWLMLCVGRHLEKSKGKKIQCSSLSFKSHLSDTGRGETTFFFRETHKRKEKNVAAQTDCSGSSWHTNY